MLRLKVGTRITLGSGLNAMAAADQSGLVQFDLFWSSPVGPV